MSTRRATRLAAVKDSPEPPRFAADAERAYPGSEHLQHAYRAAVEYLRRGGRRQWVLDQGSTAPAWRTTHED